MNDPKGRKSTHVVYDLVSVAIFGFLVATVVAALSPENLLRDDRTASIALNRPA